MQRLGKLLVHSGLITDEQLSEAIEQAAGRSLPAVLEDLGYVSEIRVAQAVAEQMGLAFVDVGSYDIDPNAATLVPQDLMRKYLVLPVRVEDDELVVAMADPANIFAIDDLTDRHPPQHPSGCRRRERPGQLDRAIHHQPDERRGHARRSRGLNQPLRDRDR